MGFAWIEVSNYSDTTSIPPVAFMDALSFNPSSTKAEVYALLTTIISVPNGSKVDIYTDSLNVIDTFHKVTNKLTSIRQLLKCNNNISWRLIDTLINKKQLLVSLHKVKAHSDDRLNDMADNFSNMARSLPPIEINPTQLPGSLMTPLWASIAPLDRNIRKFCHSVTDCHTFDNFLGNSSLIPIFDRFPITFIHWPLTQSWLHYNSTSDICSTTKSAYDAFKIKSLNHILPCGDILLKHYSDLYPATGIPFCLDQPDSNDHLGFCANLFPFINTTLDHHKSILFKLIDSNVSSNSSILPSINSYELFSPIDNNNYFNHQIYLILHQLIPQNLYNLIRSFTFNDKLTRTIIWDFLLSLHEHLYKQIWPRQCTHLRI
ncbi:ribonuclease H-like domain-containing protein [Rhizophagus irregularis DAOM 181602=DAOM 197198]|uniref:RNase H type-1 domain-containing protein n=1 Tax=Rhizophagus irregularis (strain DAOM 197198w) TaxID=1432141 RepID=A0A015JCN1_RHIIW|nr:hypothetical protein RirG_140400 [Rhizophagus irregularis DAOM 197198w]GBC27670.1 ribonuclease H-like domain-containing protein [Rhizophagus irregularis DAOM 181602=DAOM 197198]